MADNDKLASPRALARSAGVMYLTVIVAGMFAELFVRGRLIVGGDAAETAANIIGAESLFHLGFAADLVSVVAYVGVTGSLYVLLRPAGRLLALLGACFGLAGSAIMALNLLNHFAPLFYLGEAPYLAAFEPQQAQALARVSLRLHGLGYSIAGVFFAFQLLCLGWLVTGSRFLPRILGPLLGLAGLAYLANSFSIFLAPALAERMSSFILLPGLIGEGGLTLWLVAKGVDVAKWRARVDADLDRRRNG